MAEEAVAAGRRPRDRFSLNADPNTPILAGDGGSFRRDKE
jgi:hypothetical protein